MSLNKTAHHGNMVISLIPQKPLLFRAQRLFVWVRNRNQYGRNGYIAAMPWQWLYMVLKPNDTGPCRFKGHVGVNNPPLKSLKHQTWKVFVPLAVLLPTQPVWWATFWQAIQSKPDFYTLSESNEIYAAHIFPRYFIKLKISPGFFPSTKIHLDFLLWFGYLGAEVYNANQQETCQWHMARELSLTVVWACRRVTKTFVKDIFVFASYFARMQECSYLWVEPVQGLVENVKCAINKKINK